MKSGELVGERFEIQHLAGEGGMGQVYHALDRRTGERVAVKVLRRESDSQRARFEREARLLAELSHPGIVRHVAHGFLASEQPFIAMEWLDGEDLGSRLGASGLTIDESLSIALRVSEALGAAHARGVVHRDLKPSNIFLSAGRTNDAKLLDFGIAQTGVTRLTQTGTIAGTPGYMAPEHIQMSGRVDARADVFSLGCVLYECVTRTPVFAGEHAMAILAKVLFAEPPRARDTVPDLPVALDDLLARMLSKNPDERPRDGGAVAEALASIRTKSLPSAGGERAVGRRAALTGSEQRAISVVLVRGEKVSAGGDADTMDAARTAKSVMLRRGAEALGGSCGELWDGSLLVSIGGAAAATDQAAQAARCALWLRDHAPGRAVALATGSGESSGKMATGEAIDRAVKMLISGGDECAEADEGLILIDDVTAGLLDARFDVREKNGHFLLHGERELAKGVRLLLGRATPCAGRDLELSMLTQSFEHAIDEGQAHAMLVTAPAGMGKSRLAHELLARLERHASPPTVFIGRGDPLRSGSALGLLGQALRTACGIREGEPLLERQQKLLNRLAQSIRAREDRERVAWFLGEVIGTPFPDDDSEPLRAARKDAQLMRDAVRRAWLDLLQAECASGPLLLVLEDLHWGDNSSVRLIDEALRDLHDKPFMVLALARPEVHEVLQKLWAGRGMQELPLKPLGRRAGERLVRQALGDHVSADTVERILARADGNAFYLEELIRAVAERRSSDLPETVVAMVQSRLGALGPEDRRALRAASVFGEVFWPSGVAALLGTKDQSIEIADRLLRLVELEVLIKRQDSRFHGETELAFRHMLLREGAYAMLTDEDRVLGHKLAGEWLLEKGEGDATVLAMHFERGGDGSRASEWYLKAAQWAFSAGDFNAVAARAERGLECGVPGDVRIALLGMLCENTFWCNTPAETVSPYVDEILNTAPRGSAARSQAVLARLSIALQSLELDALIATLDDLLEAKPAPEARRIVIFAEIVGVYALDFRGEIRRGSAILTRLHALFEPMAECEPIAWANVIGMHAIRDSYANEDPWSAFKACEEAHRLFKTAGYRRYAVNLQYLRGSQLWNLGALEEAERDVKIELMPDEEAALLSSMRPFVLTFVLATRQAFDEATAVAEHLIETGKTLRLPLDEGRGRWVLSEVHRRKGDFDAATHEARLAQEILAVFPLEHIAVTATLAAALLANGRVAEALAEAKAALAHYEAFGACGMFRGAFVRLIHAECLMASGDPTGARSAIATARDRILANAAKIGDEYYKKTFLENVPENARTLELARQWFAE
ncbi:MAG: protein kinase [Polyangiaceae bacterium]|nr:protein kinase [Polyangiaceae bacterium]